MNKMLQIIIARLASFVLLLLVLSNSIQLSISSCSSNCQWCKENTICKECRHNLYLHNGNCISTCPAGFVEQRPSWIKTWGQEIGGRCQKKGDFGVMVWGDVKHGGDTNKMPKKGVAALFSTQYAFTALETNGRIFSWGKTRDGGTLDIEYPVDKGNVKTIFSNPYSFVALQKNGRVFSWGDRAKGGSLNAIGGSVSTIVANDKAFAALKSDGTIHAWGDLASGGITPSLTSKAKQIFSSFNAFAVLKEDGTVDAWGNTDGGGACPDVVKSNITVHTIFSNKLGFAALTSDGKSIAWGNGDDSNKNVTHLYSNDVISIFSTERAFASLKKNGTIETWGDVAYGGYNPNIMGNISSIFSTRKAFAALFLNGSVHCWGAPEYGGTTPVELYENVSMIFSSLYDFAALRTDGSVKVWGYKYSSSNYQFTGKTISIFPSRDGFAAMKDDGSLQIWDGQELTTSSIYKGIKTVVSTDGAFAAPVCHAGSWMNQSKLTCNKCHGGKYSTTSGKLSPSSCLICMKTHYCTGGSHIELCPGGTYNGFNQQTQCKTCPEGTYNLDYGSVSIAACQNCEKGKYNPKKGSIFKTECKSCQEGS